jgi:hypothetical protein
VWWMSVASAQDGSGADLLDVSRRAAVVDQVLADHADRLRDSAVYGVDQRVRAATSMSIYVVSDLTLTDPVEGAYPVELSRAFGGFLVDVLAKPGEDGSAGEQVFWFTGGGLAYGLSRPWELPVPPEADDADLPASQGDLDGEQYSDEQYAMGGRYRGFSVEAAWVRGQVLSATEDGRVDAATLEQRLDRGQVSLDSPFGASVSTRWSFGGRVENVDLGLRVNDVLDLGRPPSGPRRVPTLALGFRRSDYDGDDARNHPRIASASVTEDLGWLFGDRVDRPVIGLSARARADADLAAPGLQLGLADAAASYDGKLVVGARGGISWFHDDALNDVIGRGSVAGFDVGGHLGGAFGSAPCSTGPDAGPCAPNAGLRALLEVRVRESWAEELRFVSEYAGKPQTWVYVELLGGV